MTTRHSSAEPMIVIDELGRTFGGFAALGRISVTVTKGELFGVVGPDGAGKTTLLRILAGVLRPTTGDASVAGVSVAQEPELVKHRIAYMSQRFGLYQDLTVAENIAFYAKLYQVTAARRTERTERLYEFSRLGPFRDRLAGKLSGGMKQKLSLCCALIHEPEVLLLDEPTFGVDPISRRDLWLIVHEMVAKGVTAVVSTAYLDEAERCDRVAMLEKGAVAGLDAPAALQGRLVGRTFAVLSKDVRRTLLVLRNHRGVRSAAAFGTEVHVTTEVGVVPDTLLAELDAAGIGDAAVRALVPSLEDVFVDLTGGRHAA
jgi:ABC-type multidrug transport system ATPase subunit